jgi:ATP-dependent exoDNAse (exonuclease V) alpha subunit
MIPLSGRETYEELRRLNDWTAFYLPNAGLLPEMPSVVEMVQNDSLVKRMLEWVFGLPFANWFESWERKRKIARLSREQASSLESYFSPDVCKGHIDKHGQSAVAALAVRMEQGAEVGTADIQ